MSKVGASVFDASINVIERHNCFLSFRRSFVKLVYFTLNSFKVFFVTLHPSLTFNNITIRKCGKRGQSQVNPNHLGRYQQWFGLNNAGKASIPIAKSITPDSERFNLPFNRTMKFNLDVANFREAKFIVDELKTSLREGKTIIATKALEAWIARIFSGLHSAKEGSIGQVNTFTNILQYLRINLLKLRIIFFPSW